MATLSKSAGKRRVAVRKPAAGKRRVVARKSARARTGASRRPEADESFQTSVPPPPPVVGMGASAGGLEAFQKFFAAMPPDSGMSFVVVQHLDPHHPR